MAKGLNDGAGGASRRDQMLGRGVAKIDDALAQHDTPRGAIGQVSALGRNLRREAERIRCPRAGNLHLRAGLPGKRLGDIIGSWREGPELRMHLGEVV